MRDRIEWLVEVSVVLIAAFIGPMLFRTAVTVFAQAAGVPPVAGGAASESGEWGSSLIWAFLSSSFLEWVKRKPWLNVITERTSWGAQRIVGILLSFATALGIHVSFTPETGVLTVSGLLFGSVTAALFETVRQFVLQEMAYRLTVKNYGKV